VLVRNRCGIHRLQTGATSLESSGCKTVPHLWNPAVAYRCHIFGIQRLHTGATPVEITGCKPMPHRLAIRFPTWEADCFSADSWILVRNKDSPKRIRADMKPAAQPKMECPRGLIVYPTNHALPPRLRCASSDPRGGLNAPSLNAPRFRSGSEVLGFWGSWASPSLPLGL